MRIVGILISNFGTSLGSSEFEIGELKLCKDLRNLDLEF